MRSFRLLAVLTAVLALPPLIAGAAPTCTDPATRAACGNRVVAPALQSATFLQFDLELKPVLDAIQSIAPGIVDVKTVAQWIGTPDLKSAGGRDIYVVRVTDESVTTPKRQVAVSLSVHGNESAGREGGVRYLEDLATWWASSDRNHKLYAGEVGVPLYRVLQETEIYLGFLNPDGWADGDLGAGGVFKRTNDNNKDLNRDYPTLGWTKAAQLTEPETQGWVEMVRAMPNLSTASDIHGELTSANNAFSDLMYPAGQWGPTRQAQERQLAVHMSRTVERKFAEEGVILQKIFDLSPNKPMKPANFATAYDVVNYDDSGFMGDWFASEGAVEIDVENFLSHTAPSNVWAGALEQAHVAAVKGNIEAVVAESMITHLVQPDLDLGRVAYVFDPARVTRAAGSGKAGYSVSRMEYFDDLAADTGASVTRLAAADVATANLSAYDSLVLADLTVPADSQGRTVDRAAYIAALDRFAKDGGQLVLTDRAISLLPDLGLFTASDVKTFKHPAGHVNFGERNHRWEGDLTGVPSQTYYAVPLGFRSASNISEAPHFGIAPAAWSAKGGVTVGTINSAAIVNLGELKHGAGSIAIFGAILPTQTQTNPHTYGMADYAISVTGGDVLHSILEYRRAA